MAWRELLLAATVAASLAVPARAHEGDPRVFTRIGAVMPPLDGVTVEIRAGLADQLLVVNATGEPVEVLDSDGRPFLRIGPDRVEADLGSPDWRGSNLPQGLPGRPARRPTEWRTVARGGTWAWFDHRLHAAPARPPDARTVTRLSEWSVPLRHRGTTHVVTGHVEFRPVTGAFRTRITERPPGLDADPMDGRVPGIFAQWRGTGTLTLRGAEGEPLARFAPDGVELNAASATWQEDMRLRGNAVDVPADPAKPKWGPGASEPVFSWLDRRLSYAPGVPPDDALRSRAPTVVVEWEVPGDVDGRPVRLAGVTEWVPAGAPDDGGRGLALPIAFAVAAVGGALLVRRLAAR